MFHASFRDHTFLRRFQLRRHISRAGGMTKLLILLVSSVYFRQTNHLCQLKNIRLVITKNGFRL